MPTSVADLIALGKRQGYVTREDVEEAVPWDESRAEDPGYDEHSSALWDAALDALEANGIEIQIPPEPLREYGAERITSAHATGRVLGPLLVQNLLDIAAGQVPISYPCGGVHRDRGATSYNLVHFPGGLTLDVGVWSKDDARDDAALIHFVEHQGAVAINLVSCDRTMGFDLECWLGVDVIEGRPETTHPHTRLRRVREDVGDAFVAGLREGMATHRQFSEIKIGALGDFQPR